jgi:hypothetical protein
MMAKELHNSYDVAGKCLQAERPMRREGMLRWNRAGMIFNFHLLKIHFLLLKLFIIKEISSLWMRLLH